MVWQDWILTLGTLVLIVALFPSILGKDKPAISTSLMTGTILLIFAFVYFTLSLWFTAFTTTIACILWAILAFQKYKMIKK